MATVYPGPGPQPTIVTAQPNQMMQVQIEADKENYNFFGCSRGKHTFDVMASAAHMPAQLRAYITPEEYESAFAMSNKLKQDDQYREQKMMAFMMRKAMRMGKGTYESKVGRPKKKKPVKFAAKKKMRGRMGGRSLRRV